ncbi:MAG: polysaccharide deacetylase family protein [Candidatus Sumerlaeia bacterium]|nr:polysaccharide deacetylase family protein [Candidatus Sumerlaeia bacterium]
MKKLLQLGVMTMLLWATAVAPGTAAEKAASDSTAIRLLVRGDDIGSCHAANVACIKAYREGIVRSVEVMVCCPWFPEAVQLLKENPELDVGVHLTLTSEWDCCKWGPLTHAASLVDPNGYFFPTTSQRKDFPPNTGFLQSKWKIEEVEKELRAQIERARAHIRQVSHLSSHMGTPTCTPELRALVERLAAEYDLPLEAPMAKRAGGLGGPKTTAAEKEAALIQILETLQPGLWLMVEHPGLDTPEMQALSHRGYENVAADRDGVTKALTSERAKRIIKERGIQLVSYADVYKK